MGDTPNLPHAPDIEQAVIGAILLDGSITDQIAEILTPADFYSGRLCTIYTAILDLYKQDQPIDIVSVSESLRQGKLLPSVGGSITLVELREFTENVATSANCVKHAQIVRSDAIKREIIALCGRLSSQASSTHETAESVLQALETAVIAISKRLTGGSWKKAGDVLPESIKEIDARAKNPHALRGISTGYPDLDDKLSGLKPSSLYILGGRPSMGKTSLAMNIAEKVTNSGTPVAVFSLEMDERELITRMVCSMGRVNLSAKEPDMSTINHTLGQVDRMPLYIDDSPVATELTIRSKIRRLVLREKIGLVIVDYLQLMTASGKHESRNLDLGVISAGLKRIAKELRMPVLVLSQLSRIKRTDQRPVLEDLRDSGAIEQDADVVMFVYRPQYYGKGHPGEADIIIAKNRNGPTGTVTLAWLPEFVRFESLARAKPPAVTGG